MNGNPQQLKKLLYFYWGVFPKYDEDGKLKREINTIQSDLQHPNEYTHGATSRFLQKISNEKELLEPLIPPCRACLEHRHSYVCKNAVFALFSIIQQCDRCLSGTPGSGRPSRRVVSQLLHWEPIAKVA
ncbi:adaptin N terminal region-domain-containing protein [Lentinula raphanica]|nr:adaptin N terminal region-domain-containing protein [Lentinula raphanica]